MEHDWSPEHRSQRRINGLVLDDLGTGPALVALHGGPGLNRLPVTRGLRGLSDIVRLIVPDLTGHGESAIPVRWDTVDIDEWVDDVLRVMDGLGIERAHVFGHSFGGVVAQHFALRWPDRLGALILCATCADAAHIPAVGHAVAAVNGAEAHAAFVELFSGPVFSAVRFRELFDAFVPIYFDDQMSLEIERLRQESVLSVEAFNQGAPYLAAHDLRDQLPHVMAPTIVIGGATDLLMPPRVTQALARLIPNAQWTLIENAGHFPFLERPAEFLAALRPWLGKQAGVAEIP